MLYNKNEDAIKNIDILKKHMCILKPEQNI